MATNLVIDAKLSKWSYSTSLNNSSASLNIDGWRPVSVSRFVQTSTNFAAQLFKDGTRINVVPEGILVQSNDYIGETSSGKEMFSNSVVDISRRGLAGMAWVDANSGGYAASNELVYFSERIAA